MKYKRMHVKRLCVLILIVPLFSIAQLALADTEVGGIIRENTTWAEANSPYIVTNNILVDENVTLTIEPGVTIKFDSEKSLQVNGELIAQGTNNNKITFTSNLSSPSAGDWRWILFSDSSIDTVYDNEGNYLSGCILEHCIVEYGGYNIDNPTLHQGAIWVDQSSLFVNYCTIRDTGNYQGNGIRVNNGEIKILNSTISNTNRFGIYLRSTSFTILNTIVENNNGGIKIIDSNGNISNCTIRNNFPPGIYYWGGERIEISHNTITSNAGNHGGAGLFINPMEGEDVIIKHNAITNNTASGYHNGGGIYLTEGNYNVTIANNLIESNSAQNGSAIWVDNQATGGDPNLEIKYNEIINNSTTSDLSSTLRISAFDSIINYNNILNNAATYELYNENASTSSSVDAKHNYWGTTEESEIQTKIYDWYDDGSKSTVVFEPIAAQPYDFSGGSISGAVTDSSTEDTISGATISTSIGTQAVADAAGLYLLENISPGDYTLTVTAPLYHSLTVENVTVSAGETTTLNISLDPKTTGTVAGQVVSAEGLTPIENVTVQISNGTYTSSVNSDTNGDFTFSDITYGNYTVDLISDSYQGIPYSVTVNVDEITEMSLVAIPKSIVDDIRNGWYSQAELDQAVADAEAAKDVIIASKNQTISDLNTTIASMYTQVQLEQAVASAEAAKDEIIAQKDQMISNLNNTISAMFTQEELDGAVAHAQAAKDEVIAEKDQTISNLNQTIASMYTQQQLYQAVADAEAAKDQIIALKDQTIAGLNSTIASMYTQEQLNQAVADAAATKDEIIALKDQTISQLNSTIAVMFTQEQLNQAVLNERRRWDINDDNKISLEEAIHALQVVSGIRTQ